ncbi:hypothetical protein V6N11_058329 [Hibiscus sabdariffa]|uniref:Uncharacterized protein n=1 Tax=Hibiscus sabdariffa TaxID=183260 RepID=A0ABR2U475_9ROSI
MAVYALWRRRSRVQRPEWLVSYWPVSVALPRCHVGGTGKGPFFACPMAFPMAGKPFLAGSLFVSACGARPWPVLEIPLRFVQPSIGCVLPCSWRQKLAHLSVPMRPPCLRLHAHCPALCGCHCQSLHGPACPLSRALGWPLRFMRHNRLFLCACPRHRLLLRVHPAPSGASTNEGHDALSTRPGVYVSLNPSAGPTPLCAYAVHPWVRNLHCATCSTLDIHGQHHVQPPRRCRVR